MGTALFDMMNSWNQDYKHSHARELHLTLNNVKKMETLKQKKWRMEIAMSTFHEDIRTFGCRTKEYSNIR